MLDITHYLARERKVDEVIAVVRRGPMEVKFDKKEMEYVIDNLDQAALDQEMKRITPVLQSVGQDPETARATILEALPKALPKVSETRFRFEFLASPVQMIGDADGRLAQVEIEDNILVRTNGDTKAKGTGNRRCLEVETVIFAIGDKVDDTFGLPVEWNEFVKNPNPRFPIDGNSYEATAEDVFVGGWSRQASTGLVGLARKDGVVCSLSSDGAFLEMPYPFEEGTRITLEIDVEGVSILTKAEVRYTIERGGEGASEYPAGMGVAFSEVAPDARDRLARYLAEQNRRFGI